MDAVDKEERRSYVLAVDELRRRSMEREASRLDLLVLVGQRELARDEYAARAAALDLQAEEDLQWLMGYVMALAAE